MNPPSQEFHNAVVKQLNEKDKKEDHIQRFLMGQDINIPASNFLYLFVKSKDENMRKLVMQYLIELTKVRVIMQQLNPVLLNALKKELLEMTTVKFNDVAIRDDLASTIANLFHFIPPKDWKELIPTINSYTQCKEDEYKREIGYRVMTKCIGRSGENLQMLYKFVKDGINDDNINVAVQALRLFSVVIESGGDNLLMYEDLQPIAIKVISKAAEINNHEYCDYLNSIAQNFGEEWVGKYANEYYDLMCGILDSDCPKDRETIRSLHLFLVLYLENIPYDEVKARQKQVIEMLYKVLQNVEDMDINDWLSDKRKIDETVIVGYALPNHHNEEAEEIDGQGNGAPQVGDMDEDEEDEGNDEEDEEEQEEMEAEEQDETIKEKEINLELFERSLIINIEKSAHVVVNLFNEMIKSDKSWKHRYAALCGLEHSISFIKIFLIPHVESITFKLIDTFEDENPRVRLKAIHCLIQFILELYDSFIKKIDYKSLLFTTIKHANKEKNERVQLGYCTFIQLYLQLIEKDGSIKEELFSYKDEILNVIEILLKSPLLHVVESALPSLGSILVTLQGQFTPYYSKFAKILHSLLEKYQSTKESRPLRIRVIKTFVFMAGNAPTKMDFTKDLKKIIEYTRKQGDEFDMPFVFLRSCCNFIKVLGNDFVIHLPFVMKMLTQSVKGRGDSLVNALKFLAFILSHDRHEMDLKYCFPYIRFFMQPIFHFAKAGEDPDLKLTASALIPKLLRTCIAAKGEDHEQTRSLFIYSFGLLLDSCESEDVLEVLGEKLTYIYDLLTIMGHKQPLSEERIKQVFALFKTQKDEMVEAMEEIGDDDNEETRNIMESAFYSLYEMVGEVIKSSKTAIDIATTTIIPELIQDIKADAIDTRLSISLLCLLSDYIDAAGESIKNLIPTMVPMLVDLLQGEFHGDRFQTIYFCLGRAAQLTKASFGLANANLVMTTINHNLSSPKSKLKENLCARDNAISSIARFIRYIPQLAEYTSLIIPVFFSYLPIQDKLERVEVVINLEWILYQFPDECFGKDFSLVQKLLEIVDSFKDSLKDDIQCQKILIEMKDFIHSKLKSPAYKDKIPAKIKDNLKFLNN